MQLQNMSDFDFSKLPKVENKDADKMVMWACLFSLIFTVFFVLIPEKNIENVGRNIDEFKKKVNLEWIDSKTIQGNTLEEKILTAQYLYNQESLEGKLKFLNNVHSVLMYDKNNINRDIWLDKITKDRKVIISLLSDEVVLVKQTKFDCILANCKDKEQRVIKENLQNIKAINMVMKDYYIDLINLYENNKKKKITKEDLHYEIETALNKDELKIYNEIK